MGLGLREQGIGLCFEGLRGVVASGEASRRFLEPGELHDGLGELGRIAALLAILAVPLKSEVS